MLRLVVKGAPSTEDIQLWIVVAKRVSQLCSGTEYYVEPDATALKQLARRLHSLYTQIDLLGTFLAHELQRSGRKCT